MIKFRLISAYYFINLFMQVSYDLFTFLLVITTIYYTSYTLVSLSRTRRVETFFHLIFSTGFPTLLLINNIEMDKPPSLPHSSTIMTQQ